MAQHQVLTAVFVASVSLAACGHKGGSSSPSPATNNPASGGDGGSNTGVKVDTTGANVMNLTVNGSLCGAPQAQNVNQPCVSVVVCAPGTSNCQTISNLLLDTGSSGLRVFAAAVTVPVTPVASGSGTLAECVTFADNSSEWGEVAYADVKLASEPAVKVAMQLINSTYSTPPSLCSSTQTNPDVNEAQTGYNGILGVGLFNRDCGDGCSTDAGNGQYYSCSGSTCSPASTAIQVQNPVALLPSDNNGVILKLPTVPTNGAASVSGTLVLGIGTQSNNTPSGVTAYAADSQGMFTTTFAAFSASPITSFIDSGTNFLSLPTVAALPVCSTAQTGPDGSSLQGLFCPASLQTLTAVNNSASGTAKGTVSFQVQSAATLSNGSSSNFVFGDIAASSGSGADAVFDWGLPFFFGKNVYVGLEQASSSLGSGMYWAY